MTNDTVLLVTASYDLAADYVGRALKERAVPFLRLDTDRFPSEIKATFVPSKGLMLETGTQRVCSDEIKSVWYRRHVAPDLPSDLDRGAREFCEREARAFLEGTLATLPTTRWLSEPRALRVAEKKAYQLKIASDLGFLVPDTVITNDPVHVRSVAKSHSLVGKAVSSGYIAGESGNRAIFTSRLQDEDLKDLNDLSLAPVIFQEFVEKKLDIRVTVVGSSVFAAEILSQTSESSKVDWRATDDAHIGHRRHDLPIREVELCLEILRSLELSFGAIDLALCPNGDYVFFEVNPNGEWVWIEDQLKYPISDAIAEWLDA